jgi:peroxin-11B
VAVAARTFSPADAFDAVKAAEAAAAAAPYEAIKKQFGLSRKLLRVGKNVEHLKAAAAAADAPSMDPVLRYCAVGRQLAYALYLSLDAVTYVYFFWPFFFLFFHFFLTSSFPFIARLQF